MSAGFNLDEYVDVAERIRMFSEKHPEGTLQSEVQWPAGAATGCPVGGWVCG